MRLKVKDRVTLRGTRKSGVIVLELMIGKFKVLWDEDWRTGRTFVYEKKHLSLVQ